MDFSNLPEQCYLDRTKKISKYVPEKEVKMERFVERIWKTKFPQDILQGVRLSKLQLTNIGLYSIATPAISSALIELIQDLCICHRDLSLDFKNLEITETNGGLGGFSIRLAQHFDKLNIVEINPKHAAIIKNNLRVYGLDTHEKNITIYEKDYMDAMHDIKSDIIICDPPWGGYSYGKQKNIKLGMNNVDITCIINEVFRSSLCKIFILMAPRNYDIQNFLQGIASRNIMIRKLDKHYFIVIRN